MRVYFDLDGTLADFNRGLIEICNFQPIEQDKATKEQDDAMCDAIRAAGDFYYRLKFMPGAQAMFNYAYNMLGTDCQILSAIPKEKREIQSAKTDKEHWIEKYLPEGVVANIVYKENKKDYCTGRDCILVDDLMGNIAAWESAGGTGVLYTDSVSTMRELEKILKGHAVMPMAEKARELAYKAHEGQVDKAGRPYTEHLEYVAAHVTAEDEKCVAYLHDVLEDTDYPPEKLQAAFGNTIYEAVRAMTHREGEDYLTDYIPRLSRNPMSARVKMADLQNNMMLERLPGITDADRERVKKYQKAYDILAGK